MGVRINTNVEAMNAQRNLGITASQFAKSVEKLSSGLRINRAADDAAGLAISQRLDAQVRGLNQAQRNAQDGISLVQTAEGGLNESQSILQRMRELVIEAGTTTVSSSDKAAIQQEVTSLQAELGRIGTTTSYNGVNLLDGSFGSQATTAATIADGISAVANQGASADTYTLNVAAGTNSGLQITLTNAAGTAVAIVDDLAIPAAGATSVVNFTNGLSVTLNQNASVLNTDGKTVVVAGGSANLLVGANGTAAEKISVAIADSRTAALGVNTVDVTAGAFPGNVQATLASIDTAISAVSNTRADLGAVQNRLEHTIASLGVASENMSASESRIKDLDVAAEMVNFTKTQILQQAGTAILAQANQASQSILKLLQ
jgi:flagellin